MYLLRYLLFFGALQIVPNYATKNIKLRKILKSESLIVKTETRIIKTETWFL